MNRSEHIFHPVINFNVIKIVSHLLFPDKTDPLAFCRPLLFFFNIPSNYYCPRVHIVPMTETRKQFMHGRIKTSNVMLSDVGVYLHEFVCIHVLIAPTPYPIWFEMWSKSYLVRQSGRRPSCAMTMREGAVLYRPGPGSLNRPLISSSVKPGMHPTNGR